MYAHQVIEDFKIVPAQKLGKEYYNWFLTATESIKEAICFHLEDVAGLIEIFKNQSHNTIFQNSKYMRPPYKKIWIDFEGRSDKGNKTHLGILMLTGLALMGKIYDEVDNQYRVFSFSRSSTTHNLWVMDPIYYILNEERKGVGYHFLTDFYKDTSFAKYILGILEYFLMLMHCKNISTENHNPSAALNRSRRKNNKQVLFTYKTLNLMLPSSRHEAIIDYKHTGDHNRIHFCRGHFKEYTQERPLLGKHTGMYWWQPHVRGQNKDGIVMKDYNVNAGHLLGTAEDKTSNEIK